MKIYVILKKYPFLNKLTHLCILIFFVYIIFIVVFFYKNYTTIMLKNNQEIYFFYKVIYCVLFSWDWEIQIECKNTRSLQHDILVYYNFYLNNNFVFTICSNYLFLFFEFTTSGLLCYRCIDVFLAIGICHT